MTQHAYNWPLPGPTSSITTSVTLLAWSCICDPFWIFISSELSLLVKVRLDCRQARQKNQQTADKKAIIDGVINKHFDDPNRNISVAGKSRPITNYTSCTSIVDLFSHIQGYRFWPFPPLGGGEFLSKLKTRKNLQEDLKKGREMWGGKEEKS